MHEILITTARQVLATLAHTWPFLLAGAVVAAALGVYADQAAIARFFRGHSAASVLLATLVAVATPLCSCGTMAVILGMMASSVPWAPIVAFMAASPLTSPEETLISAGLLGWPFALTLLGASIVIGLGAGAAAHALERRGWLAGQARLAPTGAGATRLLPTVQAASLLQGAPPAGVCCADPVAANAAEGGGCYDVAVAAMPAPTPLARVAADLARSLKLDRLAVELARGGLRLLLMFAGFAFLGYFLNNLIPASWVSALFGSSSRLGIPLAALVGLPLYLNSDASLPLIRAFVDNGAGAGAALAFTITGAGTSLGAIGGALTIARWRVVGLVIAALVAGAVVAGYGFALVLGPSVR